MDALLKRSVIDMVGQITAYREKLLAAKIKAWPKANTYASNIPACTRQGVYEILAWDQKKLHDTHLQARFEEGNRQEDWVLAELTKLGTHLDFRIVETQVPLSKDMTDRYRLSGKIDAKIQFDGRRVPVEVKSMHPMFYDKVNTVADLLSDAFLSRYYRQMQAYMLGHNEQDCLLVLTDCCGHWKFLVIELDLAYAEEHVLKKLEQINQYVDLNRGKTDGWELPERIPYDEDLCAKCAFAHICLPDVLNKARVRFANDTELDHFLTEHAQLASAKKAYDELHERLKEVFESSRDPIVATDNWVVTGKTSERPSPLSPKDDWDAEDRKKFEELKKKYAKKTVAWLWKAVPQASFPAQPTQQPVAVQQQVEQTGHSKPKNPEPARPKPVVASPTAEPVIPKPVADLPGDLKPAAPEPPPAAPVPPQPVTQQKPTAEGQWGNLF